MTDKELPPGFMDIAGCPVSLKSWAVARQLTMTLGPPEVEANKGLTQAHQLALAYEFGLKQGKTEISRDTQKVDWLKRRLHEILQEL